MEPADAPAEAPAAAAAAAQPAQPPADAAADSILQLPSAETHDLVYCCKRCRRPLFTPDQLAGHEAGRHSFNYRRAAKERANPGASAAGGSGGDGGGAEDAGGPSPCTSFFLSEALQWMEEASSDVEGKLTCPKCATRLGAVRWAGGQCSCEWRLQRRYLRLGVWLRPVPGRAGRLTTAGTPLPPMPLIHPPACPQAARG
jgi:hypothetical protein